MNAKVSVDIIKSQLETYHRYKIDIENLYRLLLNRLPVSTMVILGYMLHQMEPCRGLFSSGRIGIRVWRRWLTRVFIGTRFLSNQFCERVRSYVLFSSEFEHEDLDTRTNGELGSLYFIRYIRRQNT